MPSHQAKIDDLSYVILPGKPPDGFTRRDLHDTAYRFWRSFWNEELAENGASEQVNPDDFLRQDRIGAFIDNQARVAGIHMYTVFDVRSLAVRYHSYFARHFPAEFVTALDARGVACVMSMEYLGIARPWRSRELAATIVGLGIRVGAELGVDGTIAVSRNDVGVTEQAHALGAVSIVEGVDVYNTACDLILFRMGELKAPSSMEVRRLVDHFWSRRIDFASCPPPASRVGASLSGGGEP